MAGGGGGGAAASYLRWVPLAIPTVLALVLFHWEQGPFLLQHKTFQPHSSVTTRHGDDDDESAHPAAKASEIGGDNGNIAARRASRLDAAPASTAAAAAAAVSEGGALVGEDARGKMTMMEPWEVVDLLPDVPPSVRDDDTMTRCSDAEMADEENLWRRRREGEGSSSSSSSSSSSLPMATEISLNLGRCRPPLMNVSRLNPRVVCCITHHLLSKARVFSPASMSPATQTNRSCV